jgi:hypothetical protein
MAVCPETIMILADGYARSLAPDEIGWPTARQEAAQEQRAHHRRTIGAHHRRQNPTTTA